MENGPYDTEADRLEGDDKMQHDRSNVTNRRASTGIGKPESKRNKPVRHSWHNNPEEGYEHSKIWSTEKCGKKRKLDTEEVDGNLKAEEIQICKRAVHEAIFRLNGKDVDLESHTLLELVTQLAEEQENIVDKMNGMSMEGSEKISALEELLSNTQLAVDRLSEEKNGLESELGEQLSKISLLIKENKKLKDEFLVKGNNKLFLQKLKEKLVNLEEKLEKSEAKLLRVGCCKSNDQHHLLENQLSENASSLSSEPVQILENISDELKEPSDHGKRAEGTCLKNKEEAESLEEELYSKASILDHLYNLADQYSVQLREEMQRRGSLETELKEAVKKNAFLAKNMSNNVKMSKESKIPLQINEKEHMLAVKTMIHPIPVKSYSVLTVKDTVEGTVIEEWGHSRPQKHQLKAVNTLDNLSKELEEIIAQSLKENEKINLRLEQERLKASAFEFSLEERNQDLEKMIQKQKERQLLMDANDVNAKNDIKALLNRIDIINSEKLEAEEREYKVNCDIKKYKSEIIELEMQLQECKKQISSLTSTNEEFGSLISLENKSSQEVKCQLQETLSKVDSLSKELGDLSDKSRRREEEFLSRLNDETEKVVKLGDELHFKSVALENLNVMLEEHKLQLNEERTNSKVMERELKEAILKNASLIKERSSLKLLVWAEEILALRGQLEYCLINFTKVQLEKNEVIYLDSVEKNSHGSDSQILSLLNIIKTVSGKMNDLSGLLKHKDIEYSLILKNDCCLSNSKENHKNKNVEDIYFETEELDVKVNEGRGITEVKHEEELHANKNTLYKSFTGTAEEQKLGESLEIEFKETFRYNVAYGDKKADLICGCFDQENLNGNVSLKCREIISTLEMELEKSKAELNNTTTEKNKHELMLKEEREKLQNSEKELKNALNQIEALKKNLTEMMCNDVNISARLREEMERHKQLEKELEASEVVVANFAVSEEEVILDLKEISEYKKSLEEGLKKARENISALLEENQRIKLEMAAREEERVSVTYQHVEKISRLEAPIHEYKSQLYRISCDKTELETRKEIESSSALIEYRERISELEKIVEGNACNISRLGVEKGELESLLELEKENCQKLYSQLNVALKKQENSSEKISAYEQKIAELEELVTKNSSEISSLVIEKGEFESLLISEKESCQKIFSELRDALLKLGSFSDKILDYEQKIAEMEELLLKNAANISRLGEERVELDSLLCSEKENSQNLSSRLTEALEMLDNVTKQFKETPTMAKDSDESSLLIDVEIQKVRKLEKQIEDQNEELQNLVKKEEELKIILNEGKCRKEELEMKLLKLETDVHNANSGEFCNVTEASEKISEYEEKMSELEEIVTRNESVISRLKIEKGEIELQLVSEKGNHQKISLQLNEALVHLDNVTQKLIEFSAENRNTEELSSLLDLEIQKVRRLEEELESKKVDLKKLANEMEELSAETSEYKEKIVELEELADSKAFEISRLGIEKGELELLLVSEKENNQKISSQLSIALVDLNCVTKKRDAEELIDVEIQKVSQLEEELESKEKDLEDFSWKVEELSVSLREEKCKKEELNIEFQKVMTTASSENSSKATPIDSEFCYDKDISDKISEYKDKISELEKLAATNASDISRLTFEKRKLESLLVSEKEIHQKVALQLSEALVNLEIITKELSISSAKNEDVEKLSSLLDIEIQTVKQLVKELESKKVELEKITNKLGESDTESMNKISGYENKIQEFEELVARNERLGIEKGELELQLVSEKGNCQKVSLQLSEALVNLEIITKELSVSSEKNEDVEKLSSLLDMEIQTVKQLEEELESKKVELQKISNKLEESDTESMNKISGYENKIAEFEELVARNERLGIEKGELESQLFSEKENCQKVSLQLSEALVNLEIITKELSVSSAKNEDVEKLSSLLDIEIQTVKQLEKELESKKVELEKITNKLEESDTESMNKISGYENKIAEFEELVARNESDISRLGIEKGELESQLVSEKENCQKVSLQLREALVNLEIITKELSISSAKNEDVEKLSSLLDIEIQTVKQLEKELESKKMELEKITNKMEESDTESMNKISGYENKIAEFEELVARNERLGIEKGELELQLVSEKENCQKLSLQLSEALVNLEIITKELSISSAKNEDVEKLSSLLDMEIQTVKQLEKELEYTKVELEKITNKMVESDTETLNKFSGYENKIAEFEEIVARNESDISRLGIEKGELESQLFSEKENFQKVFLQLSEALINLEIITKDLNESSAKNKNVEELEPLLHAEIKTVRELQGELKTKEEILHNYKDEKEKLAFSVIKEEEKVRKLENELETKINDLEKLSFRAGEHLSQLRDQMLITENKDLEIKRLVEKLNSQEESLNICNDMKNVAGIKVSEQTTSISELEDLVEKSKKELDKITAKNLDLESCLRSEKEISQALHSQLRDAMEKIEALSSETRDTSDDCKSKEAELHSNISAMEKLALKAEEYQFALKEEKEKFEAQDKEMCLILGDFSILKEEHERLFSELREGETTHAEQINALGTLLEQSKSEVKSITIENNELVISLASKEDRLEYIQNQLASALHEIEIITKKLNELSNQLENNSSTESKMLISIKAELGSTKNALMIHTKNEEELTNLLGTEENKVDKLSKQLSEETAKRQEAVNKNISLTDCMKTIEQRLESLLDDYKKSSENELKVMASNEELSTEVETLKAKLNMFDLGIEKLGAELNVKNNDIQMMEKRNLGLAEQLDTLTTLLEMSKSELLSLTLEKNEFVANLESKNNQIECLQAQLAISSQEIDTLTNKLNEVSDQVDSKKDKESEVILSIKAELESTKYALSVCASSEEELDNLLSEEKLKVNNLKKQLSEETANRKEVISKNMELADAKETLEQQLTLVVENHRKSSENEVKLRSKIEELSAKVEILKVKLSSSELAIEKLEAELADKVNDIPAMQKRNVELTEQIEVLNNLLEHSRSELSGVIAEKNELVSNLESKNSQLHSVQHELKNSLQEIDSLTKSLNEMSDQYESNKITELETLSVQVELESARCALLEHAKSTEELDKFLCIERCRVEDLHKQLLEERAKREEVVGKNMVLTNSMKTIEQRLLDDHKNCHENELKLMASNGELSAEITELEAKLNSYKSETENLEAELKIKLDEIAHSEKRNVELLSSLELSRKKISELEVCIKGVNEDLSLKVAEINNVTMKISQLQSALENAQSKMQSMSSEVWNHKEAEDSLRSEISQLGTALKYAEEKIRNVNEARVNELEKEKSHSKEIISKLENQIIAASDELKAVLKLSEGKISSLECELKAENRKFAQKVEEVKQLQLNRNELSELLKAEKERVSTLERKILENEEKSNVLEENLERLKAETNVQVKENGRLKNMEVKLRFEIESEKKNSLNAENELTKVKASLCLSGMKVDELKLKIRHLEMRLQEESSLVAQLKSQLVNQREALSSAREAEKSILGVVSAQEKALSLLEANKEVTDAEIKMLNGSIKERDEQLKELAQKLEEQEEYSKSMERMAEKMERRNNILVDHRIEIQNEAKAKEDTLKAEIAELRSRLDKEMTKSGPVRGDIAEFEKELRSERSRKEEVEIKLRSAVLEVQNYHSQIEEYKRELMRCKQLIFGGVKGQETENVNKPTLINCGVQTIPTTIPQVQQACFSGNGAGQCSSIDLLEQKVKQLEDDKEFLKKLCRRRHEQREELKLQLDALSSKTASTKAKR